MRFAIPRGIINHSLIEDIKWLLQATYSKLDDFSLVEKFESEFANYLDRKYCVAFPFARSAIYNVLKIKNFPCNSEVIMPPITIKAILDVVLDLGLKPVFVDIDPDTFCFDIEQLNDAIGKNTKAIIITYLFGMVPDLEKMISDCQRNGLFVIEDFSQCLNGKFNNKKVGSFGDVGVYSASSTKTLDTFGGGLFVCDDSSLNKKMKEEQNKLQPPIRKHLIKKIITNLVRNLATTRFIFHIAVFPLIRLMDYLSPGSMMKQTGERNKNMIDSLPSDWSTSYTSFQAMIGLKLINRVKSSDHERLKNVNKIKTSVDKYILPSGVEKGDNVYWQLIVYFDKVSEVQKHLQSKKVDTATTSLEKISSLSAYPTQGKTPNADRLYSNGLFIPCFPGLDDEDVNHICEALNSVQQFYL